MSGLSAGGGTLLAQTGSAGNQSLGAGNQPTVGGAGNQPAGGGVFQITWNESTEPNASQVEELGPRTNASRPFTVVGSQPTDPNNDGLYEDVNGDGQINIVDVDALQRNLNSTAVGANWSAYDYNQDNRTDIGDVLWLLRTTRGVAVNDSDGDGLPDAYERNWTNTDPTDADSDGDGVIDGSEDPDGDGLTSFMEYRIGTDPKRADTDGDGLSDGQEHSISGISPTEADTDDDGVLDPNEDLDGDNLSVANESRYNTSQQTADTDGDGLTDGSEVHIYGTDPTVADTDGDGIDDGAEIRAGLDPLSPDSDGDGVNDANETIAVTEAHNETDVSLTLRADGAVANATMDAKPSYFPNSSAHAGPTVRIENETSFENATIEIPVDESVPADEYENLSVHTWNGSANDTWSPVETTIENGTAKATVDHFSYFTVLHTEEWVSATTIEVGTPIDFNASESFRCQNACNRTTNETVLLGGEPNTRKITVEQGEKSYEVVPLSNGETIEEFYGYESAQINSPLPIFQSDTSRLFFWSGPDGISLVLLHDAPSDGSGGAITMEFDGLPLAQGSWVIKDDSGDFVNNQRWNWAWDHIHTDGGAFRGGLTNESVTIDPAFNDAAERSPLSPGTIDSWQVLSGRATEPTNESLAMDENVTIHIPGDPGEKESSGLSGDSGTANVTAQITEGTSSLAVVYQTEQTDVNPEATIDVTGPNGTTVSESLSIGTVGTVQEGINTSALDTGLANISLSADGVDMRAQVVQRSSVDTDGDGIRDSVEEQTWRLPNGDGSKFNLSATDSDTDDDGLSDSEEVSFTRKVVDGELRVEPAYARSNPADPDTDGDGLSDKFEVSETTIVVFDSHSEAYDLLNASLGEEPEDINPREYGSVKNVTSSPWEQDTDGDGVDDATEMARRTDPRNADTDGDGVDDAEELSVGRDPTLFDIRGPEVRVQTAKSYSPVFGGARYHIEAHVNDYDDIQSIRILQRGNETLDTWYPPQGNSQHYSNDSVKGSALQSIGTFAGGTVITIVAVDEHGNPTEVRALNRPSRIARNIEGSVGKISPATAKLFGAGAGFTYGASEFGYSLAHPIETATAVQHLPKAALNGHQTFNGMVGQFRNRSNVNNPFPANTPENDSYAQGYTGGYFTFFVLEFYSGEAAAKAVKESNTVRRTVQGVEKTKYLRHSLTVARAIRWGKNLPARAVGRSASWTLGKSQAFGRYALRNSKTVSKLVSVRPSLRRGLPEGLPNPKGKRYHELSAKYFRDADLGGRSADEITTAGKLMDQNSPTEVSRTLRRMDDSEQAAFLDDGLDQSQRQRLFDSWKNDPDVTAEDIGTVSKRYKQLDDAEADQLDDLIQRQGKDGIRLAEEVQSDTLSDLLTCGSGTGSGGAVYATSAGAGVSQSSGCTLDTDFLDAVADVNSKADDFDAQAFARRYNKLEGDDERRFRELAKHEDYGDSWMRAASSRKVDKSEILEGITEVSEIGEDADIQRFRAGSSVNKDYSTGVSDPYPDSSIVIEFETTETRTYYRAHKPDNKFSKWLARKDTLTDSEGEFLTKTEAENTLSLPDTPTHVTRVVVPEGYQMRVGKIKSNFGGKGGATQIEVIDDSNIPSDNFKSTQELPTDD